MAKKIFEQEFRGYWRERDSKGLPAYSGIYVVQSFYHDRELGKVSMHDLIYIGKADNINEQIRIHEKRYVWKNQLKPGEQLCFSCTPVPREDRERVAAALIRANQPIINTSYKNVFPFDTTGVHLYGDYPLLKKKSS
ncbi:GIY-YIG nuclease family protein [Sinomicrobium sp. M5D2P9]